MDHDTILTTYTKAELRLDYYRLAMYPIAFLLLACSCATMMFLYDRYPITSLLATGSFLLLTVWHPEHFGIRSTRDKAFLKYVPCILIVFS